MNRWLHYLRYFFYLAFHWNTRLAAFIIIYEIKGEKKYGIHTTGIDNLLDSVAESDRKHASIYQPVNFYIAEWLFAQLPMPSACKGAFLDAGCGKGRTLNMAAHKGFSVLYGIDISPKICNEAIETTKVIQIQFPETETNIFCEDARYFAVPDDVSVIFLFNPFDEVIMKPFINRVCQSIKRQNRPIIILYANPEHGKLWIEAGFTCIAKHRKSKWLHGEVFLYSPA